jgi:hypothetical protein
MFRQRRERDKGDESRKESRETRRKSTHNKGEIQI